MFSKISYTLGSVQQKKGAQWNGVIEPDSMWAYPEMGSIKMCMDEVYKDHGRFKKQAKTLQSWILDEFTEEKQYNKMIESIMKCFDQEGENNE